MISKKDIILNYEILKNSSYKLKEGDFFSTTAKNTNATIIMDKYLKSWNKFEITLLILSIFLIYLTTIDKKVYYVALGDEISLGMTNDGYYEKSFTIYIKEYLEKKNKLETFWDEILEEVSFSTCFKYES